MDLLDGGSDLSDLSDAPPRTPGSVQTPAGSPSPPRKEARAANIRSSRRSSARIDQSAMSEVPKSMSSTAKKKASSSKATRSSSQAVSEDAGESENKSASTTRAKIDTNDAQSSRAPAPTKSPAASMKQQRMRQSGRSRRKADSIDEDDDTKQNLRATPSEAEDVKLEANSSTPKAEARRPAKRARPVRNDEQRGSRRGNSQQATSDGPSSDIKDEDEDDKVKAPLRKRTKLTADDAFSSDLSSGDEEMQVSSSEEDEDEFGGKSNGTARPRPTKSSKVVGPKSRNSRNESSTKPDAPFRAATKSASKVSAEAKMRASIDAARDKTLKGVSGLTAKLNPQANSFRPGVKTPSTGASTPVTAAKSSATSAASKKGPQAFGKSMSGWDQLFGSISGLSSATAAPAKAAASKPTPLQAPTAPTSSASGIRPNPVLESASIDDIAQMRAQQNELYLNTDECFDLLAHAEIMLAFEQDAIFKDRKTATLFRGSRFGAGNARHTQTST